MPYWPNPHVCEVFKRFTFEAAETRDWIIRKSMLAVRLAEEREDRANLVEALNSIAKLEGHMIDRVEQRSGPLGAHTPDDLRAVIELASAVRERRVVEAQPVLPEAPPLAADPPDGPVRAAGEEDVA